MNKTHLAYLGSALAIIILGWMFWPNLTSEPAPPPRKEAEIPAPAENIDRPAGPGNIPEARVMDIETYIAQNISAISPVKEQVGGKFYVTEIKTENGKGIVSYEDGHNAYTADFTYSIDTERGITIQSFVVRE